MQSPARIQARKTIGDRTLSGEAAASRSQPGLPEDLLREASHRLKWISLIYAVGSVGFFTILWVVVPGFAQRETFPGEVATLYGSAACAVAMFVLARTGILHPGQLLDCGLIFEVVIGFSIAFTENWGIFGAGVGSWFGVSWLCVWIIVFPLIVPATPGKILLTAVVTASMGPLAYLLSVAFERSPHLPIHYMVRLFFPNYVSALIAFMGSKILYRLGNDVREARQLGQYELIECLGMGAMGEVWRANHQFLSRPAAIKLIRFEAFQKNGAEGPNVLLERFEREAEATARLRSPHSIILYDFGTSEQGTFYYVMELLDGMDLETMVHSFGPMPPGRVLHFLKQICHSLEDAHANGLIHRDIKPSNIFVCRLGQDCDFVKVLDFGLVHSMAGLAGEETRLTMTNVFAGTPAYAAPELAVCPESVDGRSDIYSLGCVAYWLLTGTLVFEAKTVTEMILNHVNTPPVAPSIRTGAKAPDRLDRVVLGCLSKRSEDRPQSAGSLRLQVEECAADNPWSQGDARRWWSTHMP